MAPSQRTAPFCSRERNPVDMVFSELCSANPRWAEKWAEAGPVDWNFIVNRGKVLLPRRKWVGHSRGGFRVEHAFYRVRFECGLSGQGNLTLSSAAASSRAKARSEGQKLAGFDAGLKASSTRTARQGFAPEGGLKITSHAHPGL